MFKTAHLAENYKIATHTVISYGSSSNEEEINKISVREE